MNRPAPTRSPPPYWWLLAFPAIAMLPTVVAEALAIALVAYTVVAPAARRLAARRARSLAVVPRPATITLGTGRDGRVVELQADQLAAHGLILGASGAGKSTTLLRILSEEISRGAPVVAIDLKGSPAFAAGLGRAAEAAGLPFRLWTPDGPGRWNPLAYGNPTELKDKLIGSERFSEPHYQRAAERYLQTALQVLAHRRDGRPPTLDEVVSLMDPRRLSGALRGLPNGLRERIQDYLADLPHDQVSAVRGLGTRLAIVTESHTGRYLRPVDPGGEPRPADATGEPRPADRGGEPTIDLRRALTEPGAVLFSLNSSRYGKLAAQLGTLVIQDLVAAAGDRLSDAALAGGSAAPPAYVAVDEFSALGADHLVGLVVRGREAGFRTLLVTQEFVDLDRAGYGLRDQVIGNTAVKIIHRQDVPASAQLVAEMIGTERVWEETYQFGGGWAAGYDTGRGTRRETERFLIHPNEIKTLRRGEAVVITKFPSARAEIVQVTPPQTDVSPPAPAAAKTPRALGRRGTAAVEPRPAERSPATAGPESRSPARSGRDKGPPSGRPMPKHSPADRAAARRPTTGPNRAGDLGHD